MVLLGQEMTLKKSHRKNHQKRHFEKIISDFFFEKSQNFVTKNQNFGYQNFEIFDFVTLDFQPIKVNKYPVADLLNGRGFFLVHDQI